MSVLQFEEALIKLGAPIPSRIWRFVGTAKKTTYLTLSWSPLRHHWAEPWGGGDEYVTVSFTSVSSERRAEVRDLYLRRIVPELAGWLRSAATAPEGWRVLRHVRHWDWAEGVLEVSGDAVP